jgi:spore maturation protein SpmA
VPPQGDLRSEEKLDSFEFYLYASISVGLVIMAGLMSGLTIGLMAMDELAIEVRWMLLCVVALPLSLLRKGRTAPERNTFGRLCAPSRSHFDSAAAIVVIIFRHVRSHARARRM